MNRMAKTNLMRAFAEIGDSRMVKKEALIHFTEHVVRPASLRLLLQLEKVYRDERHKFKQQFISYFRHLCSSILEKQRQGQKASIAELTYSLLRTEIAEGNYIYLVEASDESWLFDSQPVRSSYDATWALSMLDELEKALINRIQDYSGAVTRLDIERIKFIEAKRFHQYIVSLIRYAMPEAVKLDEFIVLNRHSSFEVWVGEYLDTSELVYKDEDKIMEAQAVKEWLEEGDVNAYAYEVYRGLNMSGETFNQTDFRYSKFYNNIFESSCFRECTFVGTTWRQCDLTNVDFSSSTVYGADFSGCNLTKAVFKYVEGKEGLLDLDDWKMPGYEKVNFIEANLSDADFTQSNLQGALFHRTCLKGTRFIAADLRHADFRNTDVSDTDFTDAKMEGALFDIDAVIRLEESQRSVILQLSYTRKENGL